MNKLSFSSAGGGILVIALCLAAGCRSGIESLYPRDGAREEVRLSVRTMSCTRSFYSGDEDKLADLNLWAYLDGELDAQCFREGTGCASASLRLFRGKPYHIYAIANCGFCEAPPDEGDVEPYVVEIPTCRFSSGLPMSSTEPVDFTWDGTAVPEAVLLPMVARYDLSYEPPAAETSTETVTSAVESVRICNVPARAKPFSSTDAQWQAAEGDCATQADIIAVNGGNSAYFYTLAGNFTGDLQAYAEIDVAYEYCDRPSEGGVSIRTEKLKYKLPLTSSGKVERSVSYNAALSPGPYGAGDADLVQRTVEEDFEAFVFFCSEDGVPVESMSFPATQSSSQVKIYYRIYPDDHDEVAVTLQGQDSKLKLVSEAVRSERVGVYYNQYSNDWQSRESSLNVTFRIERADCGITDSCPCLFISNAQALEEYQDDDPQEIEY